ncbi:MAG: threonine--tRNA ligase [Candidatus Cloacimonadota bacterium]|nr:MAG: threonine--tRNA ligase [Candidatus Cloacimonadota bacterium]
MCSDEKNTNLYKIRHSLAHIMAQAVQDLFPDVELGFGPPIETGFYYDFKFKEAFDPDCLKKIEKKMKHIIKTNQGFESYNMSADEAQTYLLENNQKLKAEHAKFLSDKGLELSFYKSGKFVDLCEGPHVEKSREIPAGCFQLDSVAGSYWKGDSNNEMLTRIYALCFENNEQLNVFIKERKLAQQRDHRKLGKELDLYVIDDEIGAGLPLWLPNGTVLKDELENYAKDVEFKAGYKRISTPHITKEDLYYRSGHLPYYKDTMYSPIDIDGENYYLKPMNCPHHHKVFSSKPKSYKDLPLRFAEYGTCYRYESSGSLTGLLRVRALSMNDAHIYCTKDQVKDEFKKVLKMHKDYYEKFRIEKYWVRLSLHAQDKDKFIDDEDGWVFTENIVRDCLEELDIKYKAEEGEAAFYGPKVDFQIRNVIGREETASTNQLDFGIADRFDLKYTGEDGDFHQPYIIHRAPLGTHERFLAFLIEHYGGAFPTWMSPVQVKLIPVADVFMDYAKELEELFFANGFRVEIDTSNDSFSKKVRKAITTKTPNMLILGDDERTNKTVTWRRYCTKVQKTISSEDFLTILKDTVSNRKMDNFEDVELLEV